MVDVERALRVCGVCVWPCGTDRRARVWTFGGSCMVTKFDLHIGHWLTRPYTRSCIGGTAPCSKRKFGRELDRRSAHRELCDTRVDHHAHLRCMGRRAILHNLISEFVHTLLCALPRQCHAIATGDLLTARGGRCAF
jgi:hypothetical protein